MIRALHTPLARIDSLRIAVRHRSLRRSLARALAVSLLGATIALAGSILLASSPAPQRALAAAAHGCPTPAAAARARTALGAAKQRYLTEAQGTVIHADLRQIASDASLLGALSASHLNAALAEANRQLVRHVVQVRVLRGSRVLEMCIRDSVSSDLHASRTRQRELHCSWKRATNLAARATHDDVGGVQLVYELYEANHVLDRYLEPTEAPAVPST